MKQLTTLAVTAPGTSTDVLLKTAAQFKDILITVESDIEKTVEQISTGNYQLLIIDKQLPIEAYNKINKLSDLLMPDAAVVNMPLQDEDFIRFKLSGLLSQWNDAQQETTYRYFDDTGLVS